MIDEEEFAAPSQLAVSRTAIVTRLGDASATSPAIGVIHR
jgi:hypothetical protein